MNLENLRAEIEAEQTWRIDELRFFQNQVSGLSEQDMDKFRRAIVVMLYAHFEGFCQFAFTLYVNTVNTEQIKCKDANYAIAAASLAELFKALRSPAAKSALFRRSLPDDSKLHLYARERDFVENSDGFFDKVVSIPDDVVDTESNLTPVVLRKNLFKLGFSHDLFNDLEGPINHLLNLRNKISHGELKDGVTQDEYEKLRNAVFRVMTEIKKHIMDALQQKHYLRPPAPAVA